jgi:sterol desaturase/sphingolipid hydroxylase (fatty acid hydroxylase superfamily)
MGPPYETWVHRSIRPQGSLRLFHSDLLESLSHVRWWAIPVFWVPVVLGLWWSSGVLGLDPRRAAGAALAGLAAWTLFEYVLHRFVFHHVFHSGRGRQLHFLMHGIHHLDPWDRTRLVFPPPAGVIVAALIFGGLWLFLPLAWALAVMVGVLTGYIAYDMMHYYLHHGRARSRWGKYLKAWHLEHHHRHPHAMWGVSSPLWDLILGTRRPAR